MALKRTGFPPRLSDLVGCKMAWVGLQWFDVHCNNVERPATAWDDLQQGGVAQDNLIHVYKKALAGPCNR